MIAIINYNAGNICSITNALGTLGVKFIVTSDPEEILSADKVIFPGQGRAAQAKQELQKLGVWDVIPQIKVPFLGICLGMQLLCIASEEDDTKGLNIIPGRVKRFSSKVGFKVPQMGWNSICSPQNDPILNGVPSESYFYFANSYYVQVSSEYVLGMGKHSDTFAALIRRDNFYGVQFHPEKSGKMGLQFLENFCKLENESVSKKQKPMEIIPAIDLIDGKCVRLSQGNYRRKTEYNTDPLEMAKKFEKQGASVIHVIDLDGAKQGQLCNSKIILKVARTVNIPVQTGGGIRTYKDAQMLLENGIERIILSTSAVKNPALIKKLVKNFNSDRIIVSVDARDGVVATNGWKEVSTILISNFFAELKTLGVTTVIFTDIAQDGMLSGPSFKSVSEVQESGLSIIVAGGISSEQDVEKLRKMNVNGVIIGKAIYEGKIDLAEIVREGFKPSSTKSSGIAKRIIACMDIDKGRVVKGTNYKNLKDAGDPVDLGTMYSDMGIDELVFLDITATTEKRKTLVELVEKISRNINIPFTVGGGIRSIDDIRTVLANGADKVAIESSAVNTPDLVAEAAQTFGSQCIVISLSPKRSGDKWEIYINGGKKNTGIDAIKFVKQMETLGAGELLINSLDRDGMKSGYDLQLLKAISEAVNIPVIASSGAGKKEHFLQAFTEGKCDAALAAGIFHSEELQIPELKQYLFSQNISLRL